MKSAHHIQWPKTWEVSCPLFQKLDIKGGWLFQQLQENAQVMARRDDGSPVWIKGRPSEFGGCVNLLSSPFHLSWSTATLQADFPTVLGLMLQKTDFSEFQRVVEAGSDIPKGVVASRAILGKSNSQEMAPGFVEFTLADGAIFPVLVQFSPDRFKERTPMPVAMHPELQKGPSGQKERMDLVLGLLLLFLFLIEVLFLLVNKKRLSLQV